MTDQTNAPTPTDLNASADRIGQRIAEAEATGVQLGANDKAAIRAALDEAQALQRKANRGCDPMNKGTSFPMGVGFTRMTKRAEQRIDASVRRAGVSVVAFNKAEQLEQHAQALLSGKGTEADKLQKAAKRELMQLALIRRLVCWKKGDKIARFTVDRVNMDRDGYPASYTISGDGIIKGVHDKVDVVREIFASDKNTFRAMVNQVKAAALEAAAHN